MFNTLLQKLGVKNQDESNFTNIPYDGPFGKLLSSLGVYKESTYHTSPKTTPQPVLDIKSGIEGSPENLASFDALKREMSSPTPQPIRTPSLDSNTITNMINVYGGKDAPLHKYAPVLAGATQYDFWKQNPELLALVPHLETSSGSNVTRPNNLANWGINFPGNNDAFSKMTPDQVLERWISGMAERDSNYAPFRTGQPLTDAELMALAKIYEPANPDYGPNLVQGRQHIRQTLGW